MKSLISALCGLLVSGCAHGNRCGDLKNIGTVYVSDRSCETRIRQVVIGSEMNIPASLKEQNLTDWKLGWKESALENGRIETAHFELIPPSGTVNEKK
jgi:hypothetical protein